MIIKCNICNKPAIIKNNYALMKCMCDEEFRIALIDNIKMGFHSDHVYLLNNSTKGDNFYDQKNECETTFYDNCG